ncbi:tetratricopeptide repeat protein [Methanococcus maripaludis]|uniref:tetratricopeptide repeat protein n=1 Tax=Methanococcus maripaludis TaxID=39152 RepID=UPI0035D45D38
MEWFRTFPNYLNEYNSSIQSYEKAVELNPKDDISWSNLGYLHYKTKKYNESIFCFEKALDLNSNNKYAWNGLGNSYLLLKNYEKALMCYEKAIEIDPLYNEPKISKSSI